MLDTIKKSWKILKPYRKSELLLFIIIIIATGMQVFASYLYQPVVNNIINNGIITKNIMVIVFQMLMTLVSMWMLGWRGQLSVKVSEKMAYDLRMKMHNVLMHRKISYFTEAKSGDIFYRYFYNIDSIRDLISNTFVEAASNAIQLLIVISILFVTSWKLSIIILVIIPIALLVNKIYGKKIEQVSKEINEASGDLASKLGENINGIQTIKIYNLYDFVKTKIGNATNMVRQAKIKSNKYNYIQQNLSSTGPLVLATAVLIAGAFLVSTHEISVGALLMLNSMANMAYRSILFFSSVGISIRASVSNIDRVIEFIEGPDENPIVTDIVSIDNNITFNNVTFSYDSSKEILHNVTFSIKPKEKLIILGETGSGKSTVINLLNGLYSDYTGEILLNGEKIREVGSYKGIVTVSQDPFLFSTTISENIKIGRLDATPEEIKEAARTALVDIFVDKLPTGYDSYVGEHGAVLSGGEKQRISIARALVSKPKILILDEATSSLDTETQKKLISNIRSYLPESIIIQITHRLEILKEDDNVILLENGIIIEKGNFVKLLEQKGRLYDLYKVFEVSTN